MLARKRVHLDVKMLSDTLLQMRADWNATRLSAGREGLLDLDWFGFDAVTIRHRHLYDDVLNPNADARKVRYSHENRPGGEIFTELKSKKKGYSVVRCLDFRLQTDHRFLQVIGPPDRKDLRHGSRGDRQGEKYADPWGPIQQPLFDRVPAHGGDSSTAAQFGPTAIGQSMRGWRRMRD